MRRLLVLLVAGAAAILVLVGTATPASAHVLPTTSVVLQVHDGSIDAETTIPLADLEAATGTTLTDDPQAEVTANTQALQAYLLSHVTPTSDDGRAWTVSVGDLAVASTGEAATTGEYAALTVTFVLTPPAGDDGRSFDLGYDVVVHQVVTHVVIVSVGSDWAAGEVDAAREIGAIQLDTTTGVITPLHIDLGDGSAWQGFTSLVALGVRHIQEGTDHQLFLLTLLLPAPLLAAGGRWRGPVGAGVAVRRIAKVTLAFTLGHSVTLALGALGVPAPQGLVESLIAVSILVAAVHAVRPVFPGHEALVAGGFGLVHGLAFSATLRALDLSGGRLALSLLGFNGGIELMQLVVVALVLPPLVLLARTPVFRPLRLVGATVTGVAALGWLVARVGYANPVAAMADGLAGYAPWLVAALWVAALVAAGRLRDRPVGSASTVSRPART